MRWIKRLFILILLVAIGVGGWVGFGLWSGLYSIYSYPPGAKYPKGVTLLIERAPREPMFNSPEVKIPPPPPREKSTGLGFSSAPAKVKALEKRTIVELPFIAWAYEKSLEP
jgi:hypothetical protein